MDKVLVAYGSGHRSTGEVALAIGDQLTRAGLHVDVRPFARAGAAATYAAMVAGCAVVGDRWEESALTYLRAQSELPARSSLFQWYPGDEVEARDPDLHRWLEERHVAEPVTFGAVLGPWSPWRTGLLWSATPLNDAELRWRAVQRWAHSLSLSLGSELVLAG
jgi:menaquinone-dependent protoporphyrinogen oxidase